jgi:mRNA-degrading endonuclease toxin of MazEF toxin-antitoxin module
LSGLSCIALPLSSQEKTGSWFIDVAIHGEKRWVLLYQIKMISVYRFQRRLATLDEADFKKVKEKTKLLLGLS